MRPSRAWGEWLAIIGMSLAALFVALLGLLLGSFTASLSGETFPLTAPMLLVAAIVTVCVVLAIGLARRSRIAYVIAAALAAWTLFGWISTILVRPEFGFWITQLGFAIPAVMVTIGLASSWRNYWRPRPTDEPPQ